MERYVISTQRSGLNWLRYCIEALYGRRTPGATSLLTEDEAPDVVITRSHDPLNYTGRAKRKVSAWTRIDPSETQGGKVLLILRHPLETFVRTADRDWSAFVNYVGNIVFFDAAASCSKKVVHYEDIVREPSAMWAVLDWLAIEPAPGLERPTLRSLEAQWDELGRRSRENYDSKASRGGGAQTKQNPTDFMFHQRRLDEEEKRRVWVFLQLKLNARQLALLARYQPETGLPRPTLRDRWRFRRA